MQSSVKICLKRHTIRIRKYDIQIIFCNYGSIPVYPSTSFTFVRAKAAQCKGWHGIIPGWFQSQIWWAWGDSNTQWVVRRHLTSQGQHTCLKHSMYINVQSFWSSPRGGSFKIYTIKWRHGINQGTWYPASLAIEQPYRQKRGLNRLSTVKSQIQLSTSTCPGQSIGRKSNSIPGSSIWVAHSDGWFPVSSRWQRGGQVSHVSLPVP